MVNGWARPNPNIVAGEDLSYFYEIRELGLIFVNKYNSYSNYLDQTKFSRWWYQNKKYLVSLVAIWVPVASLLITIGIQLYTTEEISRLEEKLEEQSEKLYRIVQKSQTNLQNHPNETKDFCHSCENCE